MKTQKFDFFLQKSSKFEFWFVTKGWNHLSFVNISPILVIETSIQRSSQVLHHGNPKIGFFFFKKVRNWLNWILPIPRVSVPREKKSPWLRWYQSYIGNLIDTSMERSSRVLQHGNTKIWIFFKKFEIDFWLLFWLVPKSWNHPSFFNISPTVVIDTRSSQVQQHGNIRIYFFSSKKIEF